MRGVVNELDPVDPAVVDLVFEKLEEVVVADGVLARARLRAGDEVDFGAAVDEVTALGVGFEGDEVAEADCAAEDENGDESAEDCYSDVAEFSIAAPSLREVAAVGAGAVAVVGGNLGETCGAPLLSGICEIRSHWLGRIESITDSTLECVEMAMQEIMNAETKKARFDVVAPIIITPFPTINVTAVTSIKFHSAFCDHCLLFSGDPINLRRLLRCQKMSQVFEGYERQYCEISANLSKKITAASVLNGEQKKQKISEVAGGLEDADALASADQRARLLMATERLEGRKTMLETEELGVSILHDLHQQRQSILQAHNTISLVFVSSLPPSGETV
ncbi:hypothetical protein SASPL_128323 [Salvia splendens]|uniref:Vesicle transport v-SNARE N-terminal domain-containing protein n=1 Tax=Salvia splendens TaxID=180675 RepID=A0A8X8XDK6_SALSN|nr:hypothetical protein SASPL_128323 [Salvia splendens]